jgi:hypothetical protein
VEAEVERRLEVLEGRLVSSLLPALLEDPQVGLLVYEALCY